MGIVRVKGKVYNIDKTKHVEVEFIVDTGAIYTGVPENLLERIGVRRLSKRKFTLANGSTVYLDVGEGRIEVDGRETVTLIIFLPKDSKPLLGSTTLELLGLEVDPITKRLKETELLLL